MNVTMVDLSGESWGREQAGCTDIGDGDEQTFCGRTCYDCVSAVWLNGDEDGELTFRFDVWQLRQDWVVLLRLRFL